MSPKSNHSGFQKVKRQPEILHHTPKMKNPPALAANILTWCSRWLKRISCDKERETRTAIVSSKKVLSFSSSASDHVSCFKIPQSIYGDTRLPRCFFNRKRKMLLSFLHEVMRRYQNTEPFWKIVLIIPYFWAGYYAFSGFFQKR